MRKNKDFTIMAMKNLEKINSLLKNVEILEKQMKNELFLMKIGTYIMCLINGIVIGIVITSM